MLLPTISATAMIVRFRLKDVFPSADSMSAPILRLMAATNDVRHLQKLLLTYHEVPTTETATTIREGEIAYVFRIFCAHLSEAGNAFRTLDSTCKKRVDTLIADDPAGRAAIEQVRRIFSDRSEDSLATALNEILNFGAFHYQQRSFIDYLEKQPEEATLALIKFSGLSRYTITDNILKDHWVDTCGGTANSLKDRMGDVISLAEGLATAVDHLLLNLFACKESAIIERKKEVLEVQTIEMLSSDKDQNKVLLELGTHRDENC